VDIQESGTPPYSKFYEWQTQGTAPVDVVDVETFFVLRGGERGALRPLTIPPDLKQSLMRGATTPFGVATVAYADVIAWNSGAHPEWKNLTWQNFWDTNAYPGPRGLRDLPASSLEAALLADSVPLDSLYPLDVDRAFRKLDELRSRTRLTLWSSGSTPIEWLTGNTVAMSTAWNGRVFDAQHPHEGPALPITMTFPDGAMIDWLWWVIPKNAPNPELAQQFILFTLRPDRQAAIARLIPYGPTNQEAVRSLPDSIAQRLPSTPGNMQRMVVRDNAWWATNIDAVEERWRVWKISGGSGS
jgi:putative spermidine/putrescine transport system substrate-binding protein